MSARSDTVITLLTGSRPTLLERTLHSFRQSAPRLAAEATWVVLVNGGDRMSRKLVPNQGRVLVTDTVLDIGGAISHLMETALRKPISHRYLLHLEDDWACSGDEQWFDRAIELLKDEKVGQVRLRHYNEQVMPANALTHQPIRWVNQGTHRRTSNAHYTFNPSLVRTEDASLVFPCSSELDAMAHFSAFDRDVVQLVPGAFMHIGTDSLRERMTQKRRPKAAKVKTTTKTYGGATVRKTKGISRDLVVTGGRRKRKRGSGTVIVDGPKIIKVAGKPHRRSAQRRRMVVPTVAAVTESLLHPLLADAETYPVTVSVVFGTYNRLKHLQRCIRSIRQACKKHTYEIVVGDGGSTDGSRDWLNAQDDVVLVDGGLDGAVKAFNACFERVRGQYTVTLNDDVMLHEDAIDNGLRYFNHPLVGQVALAFRTPSDPQYQVQQAMGHVYANYGIVRTNVARTVREICGGLWAPCYHTYGGDNELSLWVLRLGYRIAPAPDAKVDDLHVVDELRQRSNEHTKRTQSGKLFSSRWSTPQTFHFRGPMPAIEAPAVERLRVVETGEPPEARWKRLTAVDPKLGMPPKQTRLLQERVLLVYIGTPEDPQKSMVESFAQLGSAGFRAVNWLPISKEQRTNVVADALRQLDPTLVFMQLQDSSVIDPGLIKAMHTEAHDPSRIVALWSGDVGATNGPWPNLQDGWSHEYAKLVDVMFYTGTGQVRMQRERGMPNAAYLQIGYDESRYHLGSDEEWGSSHDVVFLGQNYGTQWRVIPQNDAQLRRSVVESFQKKVPRFAVFGPNWSKASALHQSRAGDVYRKSLMALNVSLTSQLERYSSDRLLRSMACGCVPLVKRFADMEGWGLVHGQNALIWNTVEEAHQLVQAWSSPIRKKELREVSLAAAELAKSRHTWNVRMRELSAILSTLRGQRWS